jgi:formyltetrahydrofolate synthetase
VGATDLAEAVVEACEQPNRFQYLYADEAAIQDKIEIVAKQVYGAKDVFLHPEADRTITQVTRDSLAHLPVCVAKTHLSLSADPSLLNDPEDFTPRARREGLHRRWLARPAVR